jgi:hypothetical protein
MILETLFEFMNDFHGLNISGAPIQS